MNIYYKFLTLLFVIGFLSSSSALKAQHPTPVEMLYAPLDNYFRFSGAGGGNLYNFYQSSGAASGVLSFDGNFNLSEKIENARRKINTVAVTFKVHPFINTLIESGDSMDVRRFAFQDNDFRIQMGARFTHLKEKEKQLLGTKRFAQGFVDLIIVPYQVENSVDPNNNTGFTTISLNAGGKFGIMTKFMGGTFGATINPQIDMLFIMDGPNSTSLEEVVYSSNTVVNNLASLPQTARGYVAGGLKIEIPLNDFLLSFDFRRYFKLGEGEELAGLTNNTLFSVGGVAMGSILKNRKKKKKRK